VLASIQKSSVIIILNRTKCRQTIQVQRPAFYVSNSLIHTNAPTQPANESINKTRHYSRQQNYLLHQSFVCWFVCMTLEKSQIFMNTSEVVVRDTRCLDPAILTEGSCKFTFAITRWRH